VSHAAAAAVTREGVDAAGPVVTRAGVAGPPAVAREGMVEHVAASAVPRLVVALAVILPTGLLLQALVNHTEYRQPLVPVVVWLAMLAAAAWLVPRAFADRLSTADTVAAIAIAVVVVTAIGLDRTPHVTPMTVDWTILGVIWLLAILALSSRPCIRTRR